MVKRVFITGAAGFIGFHVARRLKARGDHVVGYDNFNAYYDPLLKRERAEELKKMGVTVYEGDICDHLSLQKAVDFFSPTHIVHLAAQAGVRYSLQNPQAYIAANVEGFVNILEICRQRPGLQLTYASSSSVYGLNSKVPFSVSDRTDHQASLYGVTKKANELMASSYHHLYGMTAVGLRFFTVYGPWGRPDMAYFHFAHAIRSDKMIDVFNHGRMKRDFTYIDDIVDGVTAAMDIKEGCELFNLGNCKPEELGRMIELLEQHLGKKARIRYQPMQQGDVVETYADIARSREMLGFHPKVGLEEGLKRFVQWYQARDF